MHIAQLNVGRLRAPMEDPSIADFRDNLAPTAFTFRTRFDPGDDVARPGSARDACAA